VRKRLSRLRLSICQITKSPIKGVKCRWSKKPHHKKQGRRTLIYARDRASIVWGLLDRKCRKKRTTSARCPANFLDYPDNRHGVPPFAALWGRMAAREFDAGFETSCQQLGIRSYVLRAPVRPTKVTRRSQIRTHHEEFYSGDPRNNWNVRRSSNPRSDGREHNLQTPLTGPSIQALGYSRASRIPRVVRRTLTKSKPSVTNRVETSFDKI